MRKKYAGIIHVQLLLDTQARPVRHRAESRDEGLDVLGGGTRQPRVGHVVPSSLRGCPARPHPRTSLSYCHTVGNKTRKAASSKGGVKKKLTADYDDAAGVARPGLTAERRV